MESSSNYIQFLKSIRADRTPHSNGFLLDHLLGTHQLLESWNASKLVVTAGLFHSIYGTSSHTNGLVPLSLRDSIKGMLGKDTEQLVYFFCKKDANSFISQVRKMNKDRAVPADLFLMVSNEKIGVPKTVLLDIALISMANMLDQARRMTDAFDPIYFKDLQMFVGDSSQPFYSNFTAPLLKTLYAVFKWSLVHTGSARKSEQASCILDVRITGNAEKYPTSQITDWIAQCLNKVKNINITCYNFILDNLSVIAWSAGDTEKPSSSSWPNSPGLAGLNNYFPETTSTELLINALLHESIHSYLYKIELASPFNVLKRNYLPIKIVSLWTDNELFLPSFIHACFVWFGLSNFWSKVNSNVVDKVEVENLKRRAMAGFKKANLCELTGEMKVLIRPDIIDNFKAMQAEMVRLSSATL